MHIPHECSEPGASRLKIGNLEAFAVDFWRGVSRGVEALVRVGSCMRTVEAEAHRFDRLFTLRVPVALFEVDRIGRMGGEEAQEEKEAFACHVLHF